MDKYYYYGFVAEWGGANEQDFEKKLTRMAKTCNGDFSGTGCSLVTGERDFGFCFKTEKSARKFNALIGKRAKVWGINDRHLAFWVNYSAQRIAL